MPPRGSVAALEDAVGDEARDRGAHFARRADFLELARSRGTLSDLFNNRALDSRERRACQRVGRRPEIVRGPRLDARDRGNHAAVRVGNRDHVVGREELHQLQMRAIEQRPRLEHFEQVLQLRRRKSLADLRDHASHLARAQRREHSMPGQDAPVERLRNRIRQRLESARRTDDHNVGLHLDYLCACNLHPNSAICAFHTRFRGRVQSG